MSIWQALATQGFGAQLNPSDGAWTLPLTEKTDEDPYNFVGRVGLYFTMYGAISGGGDGPDSGPDFEELHMLATKFDRAAFGFPGSETVYLKIDGNRIPIEPYTVYLCNKMELSFIIQKLKDAGVEPIEISLRYGGVIPSGYSGVEEPTFFTS